MSDIVQELEEPPAVIRALYAEWRTSLDDGERARAEATLLDAERTQWAHILSGVPVG